MANMFSDGATIKVPESREECLKPTRLVQNLWVWAERVETWGIILMVIWILFGIFNAIAESQVLVEYYSYPKQEMNWGLFFLSLVETGIAAVAIYLAAHATALLIASLASIVHNTRTSADLEIYRMWRKDSAAEEIKEESKDLQEAEKSEKVVNILKIPKEQRQKDSVTPEQGADGKIICPVCKTEQRANRSVCYYCGTPFTEGEQQ